MYEESINFIDTHFNKPHHTYGIEIEVMPIDQNIAADDTSIEYRKRDLAQKLIDAGINARSEGYGHETPTHWKLVFDRSVVPGFEIVSPILMGSSGIKELKKVLDVVIENDYCTTKKCGFHVHIGAQHLSANDLRNVIKRFIKFEASLDDIMPNARRKNNNQYCRSNKEIIDYSRPHWLDTSSRKEELAKVFGSNRDSRYVKLNLLSYLRQGTVEFRQHSGTTDVDKAAAWVTFCLNFIEASRTNVTRIRELVLPFDSDSKQAKLVNLLKVGVTISDAANALETSESNVRAMINSQIRNKAGLFVSKDRNGLYRANLPFMEPDEITKQLTQDSSEYYGLTTPYIDYFNSRKDFFLKNA